MKKVLVLALGMLLIPFTAFGMQAMSDSDMESITGQSGVAISLENVQVYSHVGGEEIWFETSGNAVGLVYEEEDQNFNYLYVTTLDFTSGDPYDIALWGEGGLARGNYDGLATLNPNQYGMPQDPRVLTIRVTNTDELAGDRMFFDSADVPYVEIGLPTLELYELEGSQDIMSIYVVSDTNPLDLDLSANPDADLRIGRIHTTGGGSTTAIFGGRVGITAYGNVDDVNINTPWENE